MSSYIDTIDKNIIENLLIDDNYNELTFLYKEKKYKEKIIELQENINKKYPLMNYSIIRVVIYEQITLGEPIQIYEYTIKYNEEYIMKLKISIISDFHYAIDIYCEQYIKNLTYIDYRIKNQCFRSFNGFDFLWNILFVPIERETNSELEQKGFKPEILHIFNVFEYLHQYFKEILQFDYQYYNRIEPIDNIDNMFEMVNEIKKHRQTEYLHEVFKNASEQLKNNRELVLSLVKLNGRTLKYASNILKNDKEIVWEALKNDLNAFKYISDDLKNDRKIVLFVIKEAGVLYQYVSENLRNDREIALLSMKTHGLSLEFVSKTFKNDYEIVLTAVKHFSSALHYASDEMKNNKSIVLAAVKSEPFALVYASDELKNDFDIVFVAVTEKGNSLTYASDELKDNIDIVKAAIQKVPSAIEYASTRIKNELKKT
jgi:hypothetical protein